MLPLLLNNNSIITTNLNNIDVLLGTVVVENDGPQQMPQGFLQYHLQDTDVKHFQDYQQPKKIDQLKKIS